MIGTGAHPKVTARSVHIPIIARATINTTASLRVKNNAGNAWTSVRARLVLHSLRKERN